MDLRLLAEPLESVLGDNMLTRKVWFVTKEPHGRLFTLTHLADLLVSSAQ